MKKDNIYDEGRFVICIILQGIKYEKKYTFNIRIITKFY